MNILPSTLLTCLDNALAILVFMSSPFLASTLLYYGGYHFGFPISQFLVDQYTSLVPGIVQDPRPSSRPPRATAQSDEKVQDTAAEHNVTRSSSSGPTVHKLSGFTAIMLAVFLCGMGLAMELLGPEHGVNADGKWSLVW